MCEAMVARWVDGGGLGSGREERRRPARAALEVVVKLDDVVWTSSELALAGS